MREEREDFTYSRRSGDVRRGEERGELGAELLLMLSLLLSD